MSVFFCSAETPNGLREVFLADVCRFEAQQRKVQVEQGAHAHAGNDGADAYLAAHQQAQWDRIAQQTGMSREQLDALIAEHPEVRKGLEAQAAADAARQQQEQAQLQQRLAADIAAIGAVCPAVKDQESLVNHPSWPKVAAKMKDIRGLGVADAFILVNYSELAAGKAAGEGQRIRNNLAGKGHMVPSGSRGGGVPNMTREQEAMYRALVPGATRDEILKFHQDNMKGEQK